MLDRGFLPERSLTSCYVVCLHRGASVPWTRSLLDVRVSLTLATEHASIPGP